MIFTGVFMKVNFCDRLIFGIFYLMVGCVFSWILGFFLFAPMLVILGIAVMFMLAVSSGPLHDYLEFCLLRIEDYLNSIFTFELGTPLLIMLTFGAAMVFAFIQQMKQETKIKDEEEACAREAYFRDESEVYEDLLTRKAPWLQHERE
jgi:hypothetical protein